MVFMDNTISVVLAVLGLAFGSFAGAQVWRLRAKQLVEDKAASEPYDAKEYKKLVVLTKHHGMDDRSRCLVCGHTLAWYDLVPLVSWLSVAGKCRYCRTPIGVMEPLVELGVAATFVLSYLYWPFALATPLEWVRFGLWLVAVVLMAILCIYDTKWSLLPFGVNLAFVAVGLAFFITNITLGGTFDMGQWWSLVGAVAILAGLYFLFSLAGWVGLGDSILGLGLALFLMYWELAFVTLFLANLLGCFALIPLAMRRKLKRGAHIPFGPFLIVGATVSLFLGYDLITWALGGSGALLNSLML